MKDLFIDIRNENEIITKYFNKDLVSVDELLGAIEDLKLEVERLNEQIEDKEQYYKDNYRKIDDYEYCGVSRKEFE